MLATNAHYETINLQVPNWVNYSRGYLHAAAASRLSPLPAQMGPVKQAAY